MTINQILNEYHQDLIAFAINLSKDYHCGQDLVQDAIVKLIEREDKLQDLEPLQIKAWLFRVVKNKFIDDLRKNKRLVEMEESNAVVFNEENISFMLDGLDDKYKKLVHMRYIEGYKSREIAKALNMNASTIRNHLSVAITQLRFNYKEDL